MTLLKKLTEGIVDRDLSKEGAALRAKWEGTGLLEGLANENMKNGMAVLLENQAKQLLKEASSMAAGDVEGFAAVAFPIVRRVFGSLIANDLVAVQPMSLPSGLIFFLDFQHSDGVSGVYKGNEESLFGGGVLGSQVTGGVNLTGPNAEKSFYALNNGYTSATGSVTASVSVVASGSFGTGDADLDKLCRFDPDLASGSVVAVAVVATSALLQLNKSDLVAIKVTDTLASGSQVRRLSAKAANNTDGADATGDSFPYVRLVFAGAVGASAADLESQLEAGNVTLQFPIDDNLVAAGSPAGLGAIKGADTWSGIPVETKRISAIPKIANALFRDKANQLRRPDIVPPRGPRLRAIKK